MLKNILFDLDDTILDFKAAEGEALSAALGSFGVKPEKKHITRYSAINDKHWKMLERGEISRNEVLLHRFTEFIEEFSLPLRDEEVKSTYESNLAKCCFMVPGAADMLEKLYAGGLYRMYIVSNGTPSVQYGRIGGAGIGKYFDNIFISVEVGYEKPDKRFFEKAFSAIPGFKREDTLLIGDSLTSDILGGINSGIRTIWFNYRRLPGNPSIVPDYTLYEWSGLEELLGELRECT